MRPYQQLINIVNFNFGDSEKSLEVIDNKNISAFSVETDSLFHLFMQSQATEMGHRRLLVFIIIITTVHT